MIFILLIFSLIADQVSGQVALIPKFEAGQFGKGWTIGNHREQRNTCLKDIHLQNFQTCNFGPKYRLRHLKLTSASWCVKMIVWHHVQ